MMMLFSKKILSNEGDKTIIFDVKCSDFLPQIIKENDGIPFMSPTGHFHIKNNIKKHNAVLGGEMSVISSLMIFGMVLMMVIILQ